jgi:ERF superfamily
VRRSSETIGAIAAALAKAQAELVNPEKLMVSTIPSPNPWEADRTFRYAALSQGLDIVRKVLSGQAIAAVQTTEIDKDAGLIRLTTFLAHSSGEWLSSDWPVCPIADIAAPRRMGAALTYARRYALFTLVGIAGEDDLDAPDVKADVMSADDTLLPAGGSRSNGTRLVQDPAGPDANLGLRASEGAGRRRPSRNPSLVLPPEASVEVRERLLTEIAGFQSADEAALWAKKILPVKRTLVDTDAELVEERFRSSLISFEGDNREGPPAKNLEGEATNNDESKSAPDALGTVPNVAEVSGGVAHAAYEGPRLVAKTIRLRDKEHRKFISTQPCLICGRSPTDPHHLRYAQPRALGRKVSDEFTVPICRLHHRELHRHGDEVEWWSKLSINPVPIALGLWKSSRRGAKTAAS